MAQLTTAEAAERLHVTDARVRQLILSGSLPAEKKGRDHLIEEKDLARFIEAKKKKPAKK